MTDEELLAAVRERWGLQGAEVTPLGGGMNSRTWVVTVPRPGGGSERWVAKQVGPGLLGAFARGLRAAALLEGSGVRAGTPLRTAGGADRVHLPDGPLALLRWVEGVEVDGDDADAPAVVGAVLGAAHHVLRGVDDGSAAHFPPWLDLASDHLEVEPWVRPAVTGALARYRALAAGGGLEVGLLHADPAHDAILRPADDSGAWGLIDWSSAEHGPLLYDLASAVMYVGGLGPRGLELVDAYAAASATTAAALLPAVEVLLELRQAVQADYFARRVATNDLTGIDGPGGNLEGLHAARAFFAAHG